ncbi:unnamed protein product [Spirodela intermedia]|uniref:Uncharacterized protein n=1 Tax=Spirodela intermedia TaxID=51605 RepID=A0A7I8IK79_SPIIN|nr:unnamed protein product [Spirodela intermedia]CAA6658292.1 unnamed protein product [Spirodela intermedia]
MQREFGKREITLVDHSNRPLHSRWRRQTEEGGRR